MKPYTSPETVGHFINGTECSGAAQRQQAVFNQATGQQTRSVVLAEPADEVLAIEAAQRAFPAWADTPPIRRARTMFRFLELLYLHQDDVAAIIIDEHRNV